MIIVLIVSARNNDANGGIMSILVKIRIWTVDLDLDMRILGVDLVEDIDRRLMLGLTTTTNR